MEEKLPDNFNVVILGTGLSESILSAALSRHGCSVLQLDRNCYYGSGEAVLPLQGLLDLRSSQLSTPEDSEVNVLKFSQSSAAISNVTKYTYSISDEERGGFYRLDSLINKTIPEIESEICHLQGQLQGFEPTIDSSEPTVDSSEPTVDSSEPTVDSSEPTINSSEPTVDSSEPTIDSSEPIVDSSEPTVDSAQPTIDSSQPTVDFSRPKMVSSEVTDLLSNSNEQLVTSENIDSTILDTSVESKPEISDSNPEESDDTPSNVDSTVKNEIPGDISHALTSVVGPTPETSATSGENPECISDQMKHLIIENIKELEDKLISVREEVKESEKKVHSTIYRYMQILFQKDKSLKDDGTMEDKFKYLLEKNSAFCLDLSPKLLYGRSEMVDLLISSDVARYLEFKSVSKILTYKNNHLQVVPCSRSDVFSTKFLTMIEKRLLMRTLTICMEKDKHEKLFDEYTDKPIIEFLKSQKLTDNLIHYILSSIAMCTASCSTKQALEKITRFVQSVGRYGSTPFLWSLYGGEMNQAFCRMSAVFGGVYVLNRSISEVKINPQTNKIESIVTTDGQQVSCNWLIWNIADYSVLKEPDNSRISRAIIITDQSLHVSEMEEVLFMSLPHDDPNAEPITVLELGPGSCACPRNRGELRVLHLTCKSVHTTAEEDLKPAIEKIIPTLDPAGNEKKTPRIILSVFWNQCDYKSHMKLDNDNNTMQFHGPDSNIDPDSAVTQARLAFQKICPGAEFLPRPPNPEDIIYCDATEKSASEQENFQPATDQTGDKITNEPDSTEQIDQTEQRVPNEPSTHKPTDQTEMVTETGSLVKEAGEN